MSLRSPTLSIAKKEFFGFLNSPTGYLLIIPFLLISYFLYLKTALLMGEATLRPFFDLLPWFLLILAPAVTMKSLAEEQHLGTLETLLASPINEIQIVIGKFLGHFTFLATALAFTLTLPLSLLAFAQPDPGIFLAQYFSALFLAATFTATGIAASSLFKNQVNALLAGIATNFVLLLIGLEVVFLSLPAPLANIAAQTGILTHSQSLSRGLIDLRDIAYFVTLTAIFLSFATIKLLQRKTVENPKLRTQTHLGLSLIILIGIALNLLLQSLPLRADFTSNQQFTLSSATKKFISHLPDLVTIKLFTSQNLPAPMQLVARDTQDTLRDYQRFAKGRIQVIYLHPDTDPQAQKQAQDLGISEVQFNTLGTNKFQVEQGYLGLAIQYADQSEVIPFLENTDNLEYRLTRFISKLTQDSQKTIAFLTGHQEKSLFSDLSLLKTELESQYQTTTINLDSQDPEKEPFDLLAVIGPQQPLSATASASISSLLNQGSRALFLIDGLQVNPQFQTTTPFSSGIENLFTDYGLKLNQDLVFDTQLNNNVQLQDRFLRYVIPYPFWPRVLPNQQFTPTADLSPISLAWASSIQFTDNDQLTGQPLLKTSPNGGRQTDPSISPDQQLTPQGETPLAYAVENNQNHSRLILVGDSDLATNQLIQSHPENLAFLNNSIDWLIDNQALAGITSKPKKITLFQFQNPLQPLIFRFGNLLGAPLLVASLGTYRLIKRRKYTHQK